MLQWFTIGGVHTLASRVDWGSAPDWISGVGSVLAFVGLAVGLLWEIRKRRQDDERAAEENRDALKRHARLVLMKVLQAAGSETQKRLVLQNNGPGPIHEIETTLWVWGDEATGEYRKISTTSPLRDTTELGAREKGEVWLNLAEGERIECGQEFFPQIEFTDCEGNRWSRRDNQQPVRVLGTC